MKSLLADRRSSARTQRTVPLLLLLLLQHATPARAHFLFAEIVWRDDAPRQEVRVYFSEPAAQAGDGISFLGGRVTSLELVGPRHNVHDHDDAPPPPSIALVDSGEGYLAGALPPPGELENTPYLASGFLDYGDFGEGPDGTPKDLQYTFSAQLSSTSPGDDWPRFLHPVVGTNANSSLRDVPAGADPFTIALKNYGPPHRVVLRGVSKDTPVRACLYEGGGSNREVGCVTGTHGGAHHLTLDAVAAEVLRPCQTYFALANATVASADGRVRALWSSASATWDGPCGDFQRAPADAWFARAPFRGRPPAPAAAAPGAATVGAAAAPAPGAAYPLVSVGGAAALALVFAGGLLAGRRGRRDPGHARVSAGDDGAGGFRDEAGAGGAPATELT